MQADLETAAGRLDEAAVEGTVLDALASLGLPAAVAEVIAARVEVSSAYPAADLDATVLAETGASFGRFDTFGIEGGNSRLAEALAAPLGPALLLGTPVEAIAWDRRSVRARRAGPRRLGGRGGAGDPGRAGVGDPLRARRSRRRRRARSEESATGRRRSSTSRSSPPPGRAPCSPSPSATGATRSLRPTAARRRSRQPSRGRPPRSSGCASATGPRPGSRRVTALRPDLELDPTRRPALDLGRRSLGPGRLLRPLALGAARLGRAGPPRRAARVRGRAHRRRLARAHGGRPAQRAPRGRGRPRPLSVKCPAGISTAPATGLTLRSPAGFLALVRNVRYPARVPTKET